MDTVKYCEPSLGTQICGGGQGNSHCDQYLPDLSLLLIVYNNWDLCHE